jgi:hypothetical protein
MRDNLIPFPESRSKKVLQRSQQESRQILVAFSMLSFILVAIYSNELILKGMRPSYTVSDLGVRQQIRGLASENGNSFEKVESLRDLEWEKRLAQKLQSGTFPSEEVRAPASVGRQPSAVEQFRLQYADKYLIHLSPDGSNKILSMSFVDSETGESPIHIKHLIEDEEILLKNKSLFPFEYSTFKKVDSLNVERNVAFSSAQTPSQNEVYLLINEDGQEVGKAIFELDDQSRVLAFYFRN